MLYTQPGLPPTMPVTATASSQTAAVGVQGQIEVGGQPKLNRQRMKEYTIRTIEIFPASGSDSWSAETVRLVFPQGGMYVVRHGPGALS